MGLGWGGGWGVGAGSGGAGVRRLGKLSWEEAVLSL